MGLPFNLKSNRPAYTSDLASGGTRKRCHLPTGIVDFVGGQTETVSRFHPWSGRIQRCRLIAEALPPDHPNIPRLTIRASRPLTRIGNLDAAFLPKRPAGKQTIVFRNIQSLIKNPRCRSSRPFLSAHKPRLKRSCRAGQDYQRQLRPPISHRGKSAFSCRPNSILDAIDEP